MAHTVYILHSTVHNKYYVGQTSNLIQRLEAHNVSGTGYTSKYRPWKLLVALQVNHRSTAIKIEKYLKKKPRAFLVRVAHEDELQCYIIDKFSV